MGFISQGGNDPQAVHGPINPTSTDNGIIRWDGTTGRVAQDSQVTVDDYNYIYSEGLLGRNLIQSNVNLTIPFGSYMVAPDYLEISGILNVSGILRII